MAVTSDQLIKIQGPINRGSGPVGATALLYQGTFAKFNAAGFIVPCDGAAADVSAGVIVNRADNSAGADGDLNVDTFATGIVICKGTGFTQGDVGSKAYASDNFTVTTTAGTNTLLGTIAEFIDSETVAVRLDPQAP